MKQWKFLLSSAIAIGGIALYQTNVYSNTTPFEKITVKHETGDSQAMKDMVIAGSDSEEHIFSILNNQLQINEEAGWLKRNDLPLTQGNKKLEKILEENDSFFRGASNYAQYVVGDQHALIFYTIYQDNTTSLFMNTYNKKTKEVDTVNLVPESVEYHDIIDAYIEGDFAYLATSSIRYEEFKGEDERKIVFRKVNLKDGKIEVISEISPKWYVMLDIGVSVADNSPYLILREESDTGDNFTIHFIDLRTGETLATDEYQSTDPEVPYYLRDEQNIYRFFVTGTLDDLTVKVEQAAIGEGEVHYKELSTLEHVPFAIDMGEKIAPVPYDVDSQTSMDPLANHLFSAYIPTIADGRLYMIPSVIQDSDNENMYYVFDLGNGKIVAIGSIDAKLKAEGTTLNLFRIQKAEK